LIMTFLLFKEFLLVKGIPRNLIGVIRHFMWILMRLT
jgi:hypothetical protein